MINRLMTIKLQKKQKLRNNEYYDIQNIFDELYNKSKNRQSYRFYKLIDIITSEQNILLAYRNIKNNAGSKTAGVNKHTIEHIAQKTNTELIDYIKSRIKNYQPHKVRRVEIPKDNGKVRPLGIPTIEDRIIQQCIKQVLEPICEGKFYNHSYGFRPNRSTKDAMARCYFLAQKNGLHHVVDIDIKGFFDNVNHGKLLKQMWALGIQDKQLICIIGKMLRAPIKDIGLPTKGTPQGGILSPLLSNIVLNELDWWISNQWENIKLKHNYVRYREDKGFYDKSSKYKAQKQTDLKEIYIVRYADDFKIFCRNHKSAKKIFFATKMWLKERLNLEISEEKSKIVNLKSNYSEYLGFKMKVHDKESKLVIKSHISDKAKRNIITKLKEQVRKIQKYADIENINRYNSMVLGLQNYYKVATNVNMDFSKIAYIVNRSIHNRTKNIRGKTGIKSKCYIKFYGKYNFKEIYINKIVLFPIAGVKTTPPMNFSQQICNYTVAGRAKIHNIQRLIPIWMIRYIMENPVRDMSVEYNDNRISLYIAQGGICPISRGFLEIGNMECHHKIPKSMGGNDEYSNLIYVTKEVHKLIHSKEKDTIYKYLKKLNPKTINTKKLNNLRKLSGNFEI